MPTKDIAEKHFTEHNDIFCDLINMAFYAGEPVIKPDELQDRPKRELIEKEGTLGELERDVCKIYKKAQIAKFKTVDMQEVAGYLRQRRRHEEYQPPRENMQHVYDVVRVISALSGDKNFITVYNTLISEGKKEVTMCEMIQKIKDDSKQEGKLEGKLEAASNMLKDGLKLETIIKYTGLSLAEIKAITL